MSKPSSCFLIKEQVAKLIEIISSGAIIGAIVFTLLAGIITGDVSTPAMQYAPLGGAMIGGITAFIFSLTRGFGKRKKALPPKEAEIREGEKIPILKRH